MLKFLTAAVVLSVAVPLAAQDKPAAPPATKPAPAAAPTSQPAMPEGLLPLPDYSGGLLERSHLTGDWGGARTDLAKKGIQFEVDFTQILQSVTDGGRSTGTRYGGTLDYNLNIDLHRMGVLPGAFVRMRAESRYGESVNDISGSVIPVNTDGLMPLSNHLDDEVPFWVTSLNYTQFLGTKLGVTVGKYDTLDVANEFAGGRGTAQFLNSNFILPMPALLSVPYSTLGAGVVVMPIENMMITSLVLNTNDASSSSGFNDIGEGQTWTTSIGYQYRLGKLPGGVNAMAGYAWDNDFTHINGGLVFERGQGLSTVKKDHTWFVALDGWQYIWLEEAAKDGPINLSDGRQDLQGIGLFFRVSSADQDTNPVEYSVTGGIGAKGLIPSRDRDTIGIAYAYNRFQTGRITDLVGIHSAARAFEAYYDVAVTPAVHMTFDIQVVDPALPGIDHAVIVGGRLNMKF